MTERVSTALSARLREVRVDRGITQEDLALKTGIHHTAVGRLERGAREPRLETILRLARGLGVSPGAILDELVACLDP